MRQVTPVPLPGPPAHRLPFDLSTSSSPKSGILGQAFKGVAKRRSVMRDWRGRNALATANAVRAKMTEFARFFPAGLEYDVPYDTSPFIRVSIEKVVHTLLEAVALVFVVMFLFLQNFRYTIIPTLVVPVALLGTCAVMLASGFSINVLAIFAMMLAIGILVDDAIVVVENVERIMAEEGLSPMEATREPWTISPAPSSASCWCSPPAPNSACHLDATSPAR